MNSTVSLSIPDMMYYGGLASADGNPQMAERAYLTALALASNEEEIIHIKSQLAVIDINRRTNLRESVESLCKMAYGTFEKTGLVIPECWMNYITSLLKLPDPATVFTVPDKVNEALKDSADYHCARSIAFGMIGSPDGELTESQNVAAIDPTRAYEAAMIKMKGKPLYYSWKQFADEYSTRKKPIHGGLLKPFEFDSESYYAGKRILVAQEQGLGDLIMMMRSFIWLDDLGMDVCYYSSDEAQSDFVRSCNYRVCSTHSGPVNPSKYDYVVNLMDLLEYKDHWAQDQFKPYLHQPSKLVMCRGTSIGLNFSGNPKFEFEYCRGMYDGSVRESIRSLVAANNEILYLDEKGGRDLKDLVRVMVGLNAVITTDTMVAHMAGATGTPCLVMLAKNADWRWYHQWYGDNFHLCQQDKLMDWSSVLPEVEKFLEKYR